MCACDCECVRALGYVYSKVRCSDTHRFHIKAPIGLQKIQFHFKCGIVCRQICFILWMRPFKRKFGFHLRNAVNSQVSFQNKVNPKFHFKIRKTHFKIRKWNFKTVLLKNNKSKNVLEIDVEKDGGIFFLIKIFRLIWIFLLTMCAFFDVKTKVYWPSPVITMHLKWKGSHITWHLCRLT